MILETERLLLRRWTLADVDAIHAIFADPEVWRFLPGEPYRSTEQSAALLQRIMDRYAQWPGMGSFAAVDRECGDIVGNALLKPLEDGPEVEVGYHIGRPFWGNGYATEIARGSIQYGFERLGLERIYGVVVRENGASRRVLEKAGLVSIGTGRYYGLDCDVLIIERPKPVSSA